MGNAAILARNLARPRPRLQPGDAVTTDFHKKPKVIWIVAKVYVADHNCQSGWLVDATTEGDVLYGLDAAWFRPVVRQTELPIW